MKYVFLGTVSATSLMGLAMFWVTSDLDLERKIWLTPVVLVSSISGGIVGCWISNKLRNPTREGE